MHILVLGATGTIGGAIVRELIGHGHGVLALVRSQRAADIAAGWGARLVQGEMTTPERWLAALPPVDAVIHAAATFDGNQEWAERTLLDALLPFLSAASGTPRFIYTGGCWLFGAGSALTSEESAFDPLPAFAWSVPHVRRVLDTSGIHAIVIHPAMVYEPQGGVFHRFWRDAVERGTVRIVGSEGVRWPLVHTEDLASLYRLALERSAPGQSYLGSAIDAVTVGRIARTYAQRYRTRRSAPLVMPIDEIAAELGEWARGYARDQRQSGAKARRELGWDPRHLDPIREILAAS